MANVGGKGLLDSFFSYSGGGLRWFVVVCLHRLSLSGFTGTAYAPNSGGDLWWFAVMCGGFGFFRWFVVVSGD